MKIRLVKWFLRLLWVRYPYLMRDVVIPTGHHIHRDPGPSRKALRAVYPKAGE